MRSRYKILDDNFLYFVTSTVVNWLPVFTSDKYFQILIDTIKFYQNNSGLKVYSFVFLDNHIHMIISSPGLSQVMSSIKSYSAKETIELLAKDKNNKLLSLLEENKLKYKTESKHQFWQEGFHPQLISSEEIFIQKTDYIHLNPVRRGLVEKPEDWKYSSAAYYLKGKESLIKIDEF